MYKGASYVTEMEEKLVCVLAVKLAIPFEIVNDMDGVDETAVMLLPETALTVTPPLSLE